MSGLSKEKQELILEVIGNHKEGISGKELMDKCDGLLNHPASMYNALATMVKRDLVCRKHAYDEKTKRNRWMYFISEKKETESMNMRNSEHYMDPTASVAIHNVDYSKTAYVPMIPTVTRGELWMFNNAHGGQNRYLVLRCDDAQSTAMCVPADHNSVVYNDQFGRVQIPAEKTEKKVDYSVNIAYITTKPLKYAVKREDLFDEEAMVEIYDAIYTDIFEGSDLHHSPVEVIKEVPVEVVKEVPVKVFEEFTDPMLSEDLRLVREECNFWRDQYDRVYETLSRVYTNIFRKETDDHEN